jgi:serine/threonine protein kinase
MAESIKGKLGFPPNTLPSYRFYLHLFTYIRPNSRKLPSQKIVAIKVFEVDKPDFEAERQFQDVSIKEFIRETKVMQRVKDAGAVNINQFIEAVSVHSQLWLICEYCPGGSVKTLVCISLMSFYPVCVI